MTVKLPMVVSQHLYKVSKNEVDQGYASLLSIL
jgi:hypothetical protein